MNNLGNKGITSETKILIACAIFALFIGAVLFYGLKH